MKYLKLFKPHFGVKPVIKLSLATVTLTYIVYIIKSTLVLEHPNNTLSDIVIVNQTSSLKYLLLWTNSNDVPFNFFGKGQKVFKERNCEWTNCYVTDDKNYLGQYTNFDAIVFNGPSLLRTLYLPIKRSRHQKYIFASIESSYNYPICLEKFNNYFNWTWTYKLNSDALWSYMIVRDAKGKIIGPNTDIEWLNFDKMEPVESSFKERLKTKTKAAVWFVSNCVTANSRFSLAKSIGESLNKYNLTLDIYGECGNLECPSKDMDNCLRMVERDYYFLFAFENSFAEDYVTEKILHGLRHNTIPIVYGGANYTRYMAEYMYLNAYEMSPENLAYLMHKLITYKHKYYDFFRWKKYYSYHFKWKTPETDDYCNFCKNMNDEALTTKMSTYKSFVDWWSPKGICDY